MTHTKMKMLSTRQVAEVLGFSERTIARWCRQGKIIGAQKMGRVWRIETRNGKVNVWPEL